MQCEISIPPKNLRKNYLLTLNRAVIRKTLSQTEIGAAAEPPLSQQVVSNVLSGKTRKPKTLKSICKVLDVPYFSLFKTTAL